MTFISKLLGWDESYKISVTKTGFDSSSSDIIIKNVEGFEYWYMIIIVGFIILVGVFAFLRYRYNY